MHSSPKLLILCLLSMFLLSAQLTASSAAVPLQPAADNQGEIADASITTLESARAELDRVTALLQGVPASATPESADGQRKAALERRVALLESLMELFESEKQLQSIVDGLAQRKAAALEREQAVDDAPPATAPTNPDKETLAALRSQVEAKLEELTRMRARAAALTERIAARPRLLTEARTQQDEASRAADRIAGQDSGSKDDAAGIRLLNAELASRVAAQRIRNLENEAKRDSARQETLQLEIDTAEKELTQLESAASLYGSALAEQLQNERRQIDAEVQSKQQAAAAATDPDEKFLAEWEARIAASRKAKSEIDALLLQIESDVSDQKKRVVTARDELAGLRDFLRRAGTSGKAADRIKITYRQIPLRRKALNRSLRSGFVESLNSYRARRFDIEDTLFTLKDDFAAQLESRARSLSEAERARYAERAESLEERVRTSLREERSALNEAIGLGEQLQMALLDRLKTLDELDSFIRSKVLWIRDGKPLSTEMLAPISAESRRFVAWLRETGAQLSDERFMSSLFGLRGLGFAILFVVLLPGFLFFIRQRIRRFVIHRNDVTLDRGTSISGRVATVVGGVLSAAILPIYMLILAQFARSSELPNQLGAVVATMLLVWAWVLFLWFLARSFFAGRSITQVQFHLAPPAANSLYSSLRFVLLGAAVWLLLHRVLSIPPFDFQALPRVAYTLFLLATAAGILHLLRPRSPFLNGCLTSPTLKRFRVPVSSIIAILVVAVIVLDVAGFRYGSASMGRSLALTLAALTLALVSYSTLATIIRAVAERKQNLPDESFAEGVSLHPDADDKAETEAEAEAAPSTMAGAAPTAMAGAAPSAKAGAAPSAEPNGDPTAPPLLRFVKIAFIVMTVLVVARFWGIDQRALGTFDQIDVYSIRGSGDIDEVVTVADFIRFLVYLIGTVWILRNLPGIYEFALFPRLRADAGIKYAILTMSRYGLFAVGIMLALSAIHLDLGRLGWLMAAMGVGLGFGLQEIVSNFVSGIILLIERPIQVGDLVTVGNMSGKVTRINIRATTILNFDRQEVLVPNRGLITREVTNWTRGDTINRLTVPIGVSYDADPAEVEKILLDIARTEKNVLQDPSPSAVFMLHGESSLDFELRVFVPSPAEKIPALHSLNMRINAELRRRNIEIPYPQRDLHIRTPAASAPADPARG